MSQLKTTLMMAAIALVLAACDSQLEESMEFLL